MRCRRDGGGVAVAGAYDKAAFDDAYVELAALACPRGALRVISEAILLAQLLRDERERFGQFLQVARMIKACARFLRHLAQINIGLFVMSGVEARRINFSPDNRNVARHVCGGLELFL